MWKEVVIDYKSIVAPFVSQFYKMIVNTFPNNFANFINNGTWKLN